MSDIKMPSRSMTIALLDNLRRDFPKAYHDLLESYRDVIPHTGKYDVFASDEFLDWLYRMADHEDDRKYAASIVSEFAQTLFRERRGD